MKQLNENIFHQYNKWKTGYVRKENSLVMRLNNFITNYEIKKDSFIFGDAPELTISEDGKKVNCDGNIRILDSYLIGGKLPFPFGEVKGMFLFDKCEELISLEGSPEKIINGSFCCDFAENLTSLVGAPKEVDQITLNMCNKITSLVGCPEHVWYFSCAGCSKLTTLEGCPQKVVCDFDCKNCTSLTSLEFLPKELERLDADERIKDTMPSDVVITKKANFFNF